MLSKKYYILVFMVIAFSLFYCGCIDENINAEIISENLIDKQEEIYDLSYTEKLTVFIENESITTESHIVMKNPNMYKKIDLVNSSIHFITVSDGNSASGYDPANNLFWLVNDTSEKNMSEVPTYKKLINNDLSNYNLSYNGTEMLQGVQTYKLEMSSNIQERTGDWHYVLWIDPNIWMPLKIQSYNDNKLFITLEYENYIINSDIDDSELELNIPDDAVVMEA